MKKIDNWRRNAELGALELARTAIDRIRLSPFSTDEQSDFAARLLPDVVELQRLCKQKKRDPETGEVLPQKKEKK